MLTAAVRLFSSGQQLSMLSGHTDITATESRTHTGVATRPLFLAVQKTPENVTRSASGTSFLFILLAILDNTRWLPVFTRMPCARV